MTTMIEPLRRATQVGRGRAAVRCGEVELTYARRSIAAGGSSARSGEQA
jgi:hypothetical protein